MYFVSPRLPFRRIGFPVCISQPPGATVPRLGLEMHHFTLAQPQCGPLDVVGHTVVAEYCVHVPDRIGKLGVGVDWTVKAVQPIGED